MAVELMGIGDNNVPVGRALTALDNRYYTETEINTQMSGKEPSSWDGTQAEYDALATKDPNTTYYITG